MPMTRRQMLCALVASLAPMRGLAGGVHSAGGLAFGSSWRITTDAATDLAVLRPAIQKIMADIDEQMSPYRPRTDLSTFNKTHTTKWQPMPPALCTVVNQALRVARMTDGHFDPTVGPTVARFGFGPIEGRAGSFTEIEADKNALRKSAPDLTLDLCGIAKGYALDRVAHAIAAAGIETALVDIGGEIKGLGHHPDGRPWAVAIADPTVPDVRALRIVVPGRFALATSGHASNGITGSFSTGHIIDPKKGRPASTRLRSVSVLATSGTEADALATALFAAGSDAGVALARRHDVTAFFVTNTPTGPREITTGGFDTHILA